MQRPRISFAAKNLSIRKYKRKENFWLRLLKYGIRLSAGLKDICFNRLVGGIGRAVAEIITSIRYSYGPFGKQYGFQDRFYRTVEGSIAGIRTPIRQVFTELSDRLVQKLFSIHYGMASCTAVNIPTHSLEAAFARIYYQKRSCLSRKKSCELTKVRSFSLSINLSTSWQTLKNEGM